MGTLRSPGIFPSFLRIDTQAGSELHLKGKRASKDFCGLGENSSFYPIYKDTLGIPRPGAFKDICVLWGKEQNRSVSKCLRKKNLEVEVGTSPALVPCVHVCQRENTEAGQSHFSLLLWGGRGGRAWTDGVFE